MTVRPPVLCLLVLAALLPSGQTRTVGSQSPLLKTSSLSETENMCADCTKITELFLDMISKKDTQALIQESLFTLCRRLPRVKTVNNCMKKVEMYLPVVMKDFLSFTAHREGEICSLLGLCAVQSESKTPEVLQVSLEAGGSIQAQPSTGTDHEVQITPQCTFCLFILKKLEDMLPKERTEESVVKALEKICDHLPEHYKDECDNFLEKYGKQIIDFLLTSATPHTICALLHLCLFQQRPAMVPSPPSDCQFCRTLVILTQVHLGQNASEPQTSSVLQQTCHQHPNTLPGCELFIQHHGQTLVRILGKQEEAVNACQKFFCTGHD